MIHPHDWEQLGLDGPTADLGAVRRAYSLRLRVTRPDDDAQAYQRLREAYDRVVEALRSGIAPETPQAEAAPETPAAEPPVEHTSVVAPADDLLQATDDLLDRLHRVLETEGEAAAVAALPALCAALERLPLDSRDNASARFADWVIAHPELPTSVVEPLSGHFDWRALDYRAARRLGPDRAEALAAALRVSRQVFRPAPPAPPPQPPSLPERTLLDLQGLGRLLDSGRLLRAWFVATLLPGLLPSTARRAGPEVLTGLGLPSHVHGHVEGYIAIGVMTRLAVLVSCTFALCRIGDPRMSAVAATVAALVVARIVEQLVAALVLLTPHPPGPRDRAARWGLAVLFLAAVLAVPAQFSDQRGLMILPAVAGAFGLLIAMPRRPDAGIAALVFAAWVAAVVPGWPVAPLLLVFAWTMGAAHVEDSPVPARWRAAWREGGVPRRLCVLLQAAPAALPLAVVAVARRHGLIPMRWAAMLAILLHAIVPAAAAGTAWRLTWMPAILAVLVALRVAGAHLARQAMPNDG